MRSVARRFCAASSPLGVRPSRGFTLVETLIVIVIVAIVSSVIVVQMQYNTRHAELATLRYNENLLNRVISVYTTDHFGRTPEVKDASLPQLLSHTDANGSIGAFGSSFPLGPYLAGNELPLNPRTNSRAVNETANFPPAAYQGGGWLYHRASGRIVADHKPGNTFKALVEVPLTEGLSVK
jgi:prepilin-type N-terminal cleavage/methylation domain-containing protein